MDTQERLFVGGAKTLGAYFAATVLSFIPFAESSHGMSAVAMVFFSPMIAPAMPPLFVRDLLAGTPVSRELTGMFILFCVLFPTALAIDLRSRLLARVRSQRGP